MIKSLLCLALLFSLSTSTLPLSISHDICGRKVCQPVRQCYVPSCGLENYCTNRDYFNFNLRNLLKKIKVKKNSLRQRIKKMRKRRKAILGDLRRKRNQIRKEAKKVRQNLKKRRKALRAAVRKSMAEMRKQRKKFRNAFRKKRQCGYGCFPVGDDGGNDSGKSAGSMDSMGGDGDDEMSTKSDMDDDEEMSEIIRSEDPLENLRKKCQKDVSVLAQFLKNKKNKKLAPFLLFGDADDCDSDCEVKTTNIFSIWMGLIRNFKGVCIQNNYHKIGNCGLRKMKMKRTFVDLCRPYEKTLRQALLYHYDYLFGGLGCGPLTW